jgi:sugar lactone lactonase YvrE
VDEPFIYTITASGQPTSFAAVGLPAGLTLSSISGVITGTATASGTFAVTLSATNSGVMGTLALTLIVLPSTTITTLAGKLGTSGSTDGTASAASFNSPSDVVADMTGVLYVADSGNHTIRKIALSGAVTTLAGQAGTSGSLDATGLNARFNEPSGVAVDSIGNLFVSDAGNSVIRKITPAGVVTTIAGMAGSAGTTDGIGSSAQFNYPSDLVIDSGSNLYVADTGNHTVRKITIGVSSVTVSTFAGQPGVSGSTDGVGNAAKFKTPLGLAIDNSGNLYVADAGNSVIRKITTGAGTVTVSTLAGQDGVPGGIDGVGTSALFKAPAGLVVDRNGDLYVADTSNYVIRRITPSTGLVITLAGMSGILGSVDGAGRAARFNSPSGMTTDASGYVYVADFGSHAVRVMSRAPIITTQPQSQTASASANVTFTVAASGQPTPTYKWYKDDMDISGATTASLSLTNVQTTSAGTYKATAINGSGTAPSDAATLVVTGTSSSSSSSSSGSGPSGSSSSGGGSGGGGGAPSAWLLIALVLLGFIRLLRRQQNVKTAICDV